MTIRRRGSIFVRVATPLRLWAQRFVVVIFTITALSLLVLEKISPQKIEKLRVNLAELVVPASDTAAQPLRKLEESFSYYLSSQSNTQQSVDLLEQQLEEVRARLRFVEAENEKLTNLTASKEENYIIAQVVGDRNGPFSRALLARAGSQQKVELDQTALTEEGLVGRVIGVSANLARILLITDINASTPVVNLRTKEQAVVRGVSKEKNKLEIRYLSADADIQNGDVYVTSGFSGLYPQGIPVGKVSEVDDNLFYLESFVGWSQLEYVRLVSRSEEEQIGDPVEIFAERQAEEKEQKQETIQKQEEMGGSSEELIQEETPQEETVPVENFQQNASEESPQEDAGQ